VSMQAEHLPYTCPSGTGWADHERPPSRVSRTLAGQPGVCAHGADPRTHPCCDVIHVASTGSTVPESFAEPAAGSCFTAVVEDGGEVDETGGAAGWGGAPRVAW